MELQRILLIICYMILQIYGFKDKKGTLVKDIELYAYKASFHIKIESRETRICSAAIIDVTHLLTTATCFYLYYNVKYEAYVRVGSIKAHTDGIIHAVKTPPIKHPMFNFETRRHNIAIVTIKEYVMEFGSSVNKIPINYDYIEGCKEVTIIGFGQPFVSVNNLAKDLYMTTSLTMDIYQCGDALQKSVASKSFYEESLCIKPTGNSIELCASDEGSMIIYKNQLIGMLSHLPGGLGCSGNLPYLFTRIGHYHSWLNTHINAHLFEKPFY